MAQGMCFWSRNAIRSCPKCNDVKPIIVVGGGPAGSNCARAIALLGYPVVLLEGCLARKTQQIETCSASVRRTLENVCGSLPPTVLGDLDTFHSTWGSSEPEARRFHFWQAGSGARISRAGLDLSLLDAAERSGATVLRGHRARTGRSEGADWIVAVENQAGTFELSGCFVVEAMGGIARSPFQPGNSRIFTDNLICLSADIPDIESDNAIAAVEAVPEGWWFTTALDGRRTVSMFTDADLLPAPMAWRDWFTSVLSRTHHITSIIPNAVPKRIVATSARTSVRRRVWRNSWLAIGDSARTVDPLSGGGIGRALEDGQEGAEAVFRAVVKGETATLRSFAVQTVERFIQAETIRRLYYCNEGRWQFAPFWRRRVEALTAASGQPITGPDA